MTTRTEGWIRWAVLAIAVPLAVSAAPAHAWRQTFAGTGADAIIDGNGDVVAGGVLQGPSSDFGVVKLAGDDGSELWTHPLSFGGARVVAVDAVGDVVAAGTLVLAFHVVKLDGGNGSELWQRTVPGDGLGPDGALALALDDAGDVAVAGRFMQFMPGPDIPYSDVVKLAGGDGSILWQVPGIVAGALEDIAFDAAGDVLACGSSFAVGFGFQVVKLAGADGAEIWRYTEADLGATSLALHPSGDVLVSGRVDGAGQVVRLDGATGAELWRHAFSDYGYDVAVDAAGDVVALGDTIVALPDEDLTVVKLDDGDGSELWRRSLSGAGSSQDHGASLSLDAVGDVLVAGELASAAPPSDFFVAKLSGSDGSEIWRRSWSADVPAGGRDMARRVRAHPSGDAVAAGSLDLGGDERLAVVRLSGVDGGVGLVTGARLLVADDADDPARRRVAAKSKDPSLLVPAAGGSSDPTLHGAAVWLGNPASGEQVRLDLPASHWQASPTGYRYRDAPGDNGPCARVVIRAGKLLLHCRGKHAPLDFSLNEPSQGSLLVGARFGTGSPQCAWFGGIVGRDQGTAAPGPRGRFAARKASSLSGAACEVPP